MSRKQKPPRQTTLELVLLMEKIRNELSHVRAFANNHEIIGKVMRDFQAATAAKTRRK